MTPLRAVIPTPEIRSPQLWIADRCTACGLCLSTCPEGALRPAPRRPVVTSDRCTACLECIEVCPVDAISLTVGPLR